MILSLSQTRRFTLLILLALFTGILFLSFVPTSHSYYSYYITPPHSSSPSSATNQHSTLSPTDPNCDPFNLNTHLHYNKTYPLETHFTTYDHICEASHPLWVTQLWELESNDPPLEALKDKTVLFIGDSVDRFLLYDLCTFLNGTFSMHPIDSYKKTINDTVVKAHHALPRSCVIDGPSGKQGLVLMNYFFYGFDENDMWRDKVSTWSEPPRFKDRWEMFEFEAYPSIFGEEGILAGRDGPDLVIVNMGFWELARFDRLDEQRQFREGVDDEELVDPVTVNEGFVEEFIGKTVEFLGRLRRLVGGDARIRWRQMHTPSISTGPYFIDHNTGTKKKSRGRFTPVKIRVLNEAAEWACEVASGNEAERKRRERSESGQWEKGGESWWRKVEEEEVQEVQEDGRITVWPVGDLMAPWPTRQWLRDDVHPTESAGVMVWGGGVFEYLARTLKRKSG
ncbi:hypothetical protein L211DRAFT_432991 [Terfezia boudieri ATCC MYA-4762]|uniref:Uncharacterized protein n=1 Tax=Terfezia boudieri ATCC MYA-4762 TaxID=1051890 RepID=A0A3N4LEV4_9PEZI|nr:hypothetical protein L211DRAFT_432991 [Terfezia boudieri ATCC MYA-4762]